ncbi:MAG: hypothetical protein H6868_02100 [Rhodospirillales bacterium]|nr:hypothetical protein [Rhodospirillales bacterium]
MARYFAFAGVLFVLSACGFSPMYGSHSAMESAAVSGQMDRIYIDNIKDRSGQFLRNALIDRFYKSGRPADPLYTLEIKPVEERITDLDITKTSDATRAQLRLDTEMTLVDKTTGETLLKRELMAMTSFNILEGRFTTRVSERNARENALNDLARQIELQLALYFDRRP